VITVTHPTGNAFVRALLDHLEREHRLTRFFTTIATRNRRSYPIPAARIDTNPARELTRLALQSLRTPLTRHETGWASVDAIYRALDQRTARWVKTNARSVTWVYAYEDGALETFLAARRAGIRRACELPIAYWTTTRHLLREEAARLPEWEPTLGATRDSGEKLARKTEELNLADLIVCPSQFVIDSLPPQARARSLLAPFGSPPATPRKQRPAGPLRVLFAGAMTQRKGLADLFAAMKLLRRPDIQLVVMGSALMPMEFYRKQFDAFVYEPPRPPAAVLDLMAACDVLALPSIVEGRALVQQEAMSCGLPVLATRNAGAEELIAEAGFLVPIRSPEDIAAHLQRLADDRSLLETMSRRAQAAAARYTWQSYAAGIAAALQP
jgi:glycosyltransferase involved in cell wall biosynthesis